MSLANRNDEDDRTQDLLHKLELQQLPYHEMAKTAKEVAEVRKRRRDAKDTVEELEPIVAFINENQGTIRAMERLLGTVRKVENRHRNRFYVPRCSAGETNKK